MRGGKGKLKFRLDRSFSNLPDEEGSTEVLGPPRVLDHEEPHLDETDLPAVTAPGRAGRRKRQDARPVELAVDEPRMSAREARDDYALDDAPGLGEGAAPVEEVLVINVISRDPNGFKGPALLQNILESGLRFGDMDIFHRHESMAGNGEVLFSMANAVKPGVFDLDDIDHFTTRAVSFFLGLPGPRHPKPAFEVMVAAARKLAHELDGELKDDQRSVLTAQTIEHYRQRIVEFERRALTHKR
jgi:cell division protein ZipA